MVEEIRVGQQCLSSQYSCGSFPLNIEVGINNMYLTFKLSKFSFATNFWVLNVDFYCRLPCGLCIVKSHCTLSKYCTVHKALFRCQLYFCYVNLCSCSCRTALLRHCTSLYLDRCMVKFASTCIHLLHQNHKQT